MEIHGDSTDLCKHLTVKLNVQCEHELSKTDKSSCWRVGRMSGTTVQKEGKRLKSISMGYGSVQ